MKRTDCGNGCACRQGRDCPSRKPVPLRRALAAFWQALEDHPFLPLLIALVLLVIVNFPT